MVSIEIVLSHWFEGTCLEGYVCVWEAACVHDTHRDTHKGVCVHAMGACENMAGPVCSPRKGYMCLLIVCGVAFVSTEVCVKGCV